MKIYSVAWGWTLTPEDMPEGESLHRIADSVKSLGFDGIDFLATRESLDEFFTQDRSATLFTYCSALSLPIGGIAFQSDDWNNPDCEASKKQLSYFAKCAHLAAELHAPNVSCILPHPFGAKPTRNNASPSEKRGYHLPADYDYAADWARFIKNIREACRIATEEGVNVVLECFPGSICATPEAMKRALADIDMPNFGIQLDTAHLFNQRIDVETAIFMLGGKAIRHVHFKDTDGMTRQNLPAGWGLIDYRAVLRALNAVSYEGNSSIEVEFTDDPARYMMEGQRHIRECLELLC